MTSTTTTMTLQRSLKHDKEAFVTGHDGTTPWEILLVCFVVISGTALYGQVVQHQQRSQLRRLLFSLVVEAISVWFPIVLNQTNFLYPWGVIVMMLQTGVAYVLRQRQAIPPPPPPPPPVAVDRGQQQEHQQQRPRQLDYLTLYRASIMYLTFVAILAVDFHVFPRRFCKTETEGYGLMDVGAASFCISAGFVSQRSRRRRIIANSSSNSSNRSSLRRQEENFRSPQRTASSLFKPLVHTLPLILIGLIRIFANQELDYQEHVSEYGVHWNFFFTMGVLALVPPLVSSSTIILSSSSTPADSQSRPTLTVPIFLMSFYQWSLNETGGNWQSFIENAPRRCFIDDSESNDNDDDNLLSLQRWNDDRNNHNSFKQLVMSLPPMFCNFVIANREGILGCFGYLSLYFTGEWIGYHWIWKPSIVETMDGSHEQQQQHKQKKGGLQEQQQDHGLGHVAMILWIMHLVLVHWFGIPVSRRSTNLSFCTWALAHNVLLLYLLQELTLRSTKVNDSRSPPMLSNYYGSLSQVPMVFEKVNSYGLIMFLVANLLTGLVNLTVPTLEISDVNALFIVYGYICAVGVAAMLVDWGARFIVTQRHRDKE